MGSGLDLRGFSWVCDVGRHKVIGALLCVSGLPILIMTPRLRTLQHQMIITTTLGREDLRHFTAVLTDLRPDFIQHVQGKQRVKVLSGTFGEASNLLHELRIEPLMGLLIGSNTRLGYKRIFRSGSVQV